MGPADGQVKLIHIHQDQVVRLPAEATPHGSTSFCENAMFSIADNVFCMQGHPEFEPDYTAALMTARSDSMGPDRVAHALGTLDDGHEGDRVAGWIVDFSGTMRVPARRPDGARKPPTTSSRDIAS